MLKTTVFSVYIFLLLVLISSCSRPVSSFQIPDQQVIAPSEVKFQNTSEQALEYVWDFGDGTTSQEAEPSHRYRGSGNFPVTLTAKKGNKQAVSKQIVQVSAPAECLVFMQTSMGPITIKLFNDTPKHRDNFLKLAKEGYYQDLLFHRVINGFMIQGGDPASRDASATQRLGGGGPGYKIPAEITPNHAHVKGALAAARDNNPEKSSSGAQFYLVHGSPVSEAQLKKQENSKGISYSNDLKALYLKNGGSPQLDNEYTVFGQVVEGMDVIDKIAQVKTNAADRPEADVKMEVFVVF